MTGKTPQTEMGWSEEARRASAVAPFDFVVFGASGDLSLRKILPALYMREADGQIPTSSRLVLLSRHNSTVASYAKPVREFIAASGVALDAAVWARFEARMHTVAIDITGEGGWQTLAELIGANERNRIYYLSTASTLFGEACRKLAVHGLVDGQARVVLEKPLGHDGKGAEAINEEVLAVFTEQQIYRIDHYLGKETVQNLMALRFANRLFEAQWNNTGIDHVQITVAESIGVGSRGGYYDKYGALRDMVQNHLLQLLCLVAMESPVRVDADSVRDEKLKVLKALKPIDANGFSQHVVFGQYRAGFAEGHAVPGYLEELGADGSGTETFVALKAEIENWRWAGVPFYLRTGKRMPMRTSEIAITFKDVPHSIFPLLTGEIQPNRLIMHLQPDEGLELQLNSKTPGPGGMRLKPTSLNLDFKDAFQTRFPDAYERLLMDVARANQTLFMRRDEVAAAWDWVDPILAHKEAAELRPEPYQAGSWGPSQAVALIVRDQRVWRDPEIRR